MWLKLLEEIFDWFRNPSYAPWFTAFPFERDIFPTFLDVNYVQWVEQIGNGGINDAQPCL